MLPGCRRDPHARADRVPSSGATFSLRRPAPTSTTLESIEHQAAGASARLAAVRSLLRGLAADYLAGGFTADLLDGVSERPLHDAVPLRYLATGHRLALRRATRPSWPRIYPSCGGAWDGE